MGNLIEDGDLVDAMDINGNTPLINTIQNPSEKQEETVEFLLENGANPNAQGMNATTPVLAAAGGPSVEIIEMLVSAGADISSKDNNGQTALEIAALSGQKKIVQFLLDNDFETDRQTLIRLLDSAPKFVRKVIDEWLKARQEVSVYKIFLVQGYPMFSEAISHRLVREIKGFFSACILAFLSTSN